MRSRSVQIVILAILCMSLVACRAQIVVFGPDRVEYNTPEIRKKVREEADEALRSLVASAQAILGPDVTVDATTTSASYDDKAVAGTGFGFAATYAFSAWPDGDPASAYAFNLSVFSGERLATGGGRQASQPLNEVDLASNELAGFAELSRDRVAPMLRYMSLLDRTADEPVMLIAMDPVLKDVFGHEIDWQKTLREQCVQAGYLPADCEILVWHPLGMTGDEDAYQLVRFDAASRKWILLQEFRGDPAEGGFKLNTGKGS